MPNILHYSFHKWRGTAAFGERPPPFRPWSKMARRGERERETQTRMCAMAAVNPSLNPAGVFLISTHCFTAGVYLWLPGSCTLSQPLCQPLYSQWPNKQPHPWWNTGTTAQNATSNAAVLPLFERASQRPARCWRCRGDSLKQKTVAGLLISACVEAQGKPGVHITSVKLDMSH